jgi:hypothetical protein
LEPAARLFKKVKENRDNNHLSTVEKSQQRFANEMENREGLNSQSDFHLMAYIVIH